MEPINTANYRTSTFYGPRIDIQALSYVDDLNSPVSKAVTEKVVANVNHLEIRKKMSVNMDKSSYLVINKKKNENTEIKSTVNKGKIKLAKEQEYLGTWINEKASCRFNIEKRIAKSKAVTSKIEKMTCPSRVGNLSVALKLELYSVVQISVLLYNLSAWAKWTKSDIDMLERFQANTLKRLLKLPVSTPNLGLLWETGIWRISDEILYKQIMLLHNIMKSESRRLIRQIIIEQNNHPIPNCWLENLKERAGVVGYNINIEEIATRTKTSLKKEVKEILHANFVKYVNQNSTTKLRTVIMNSFSRRKYINEGMLNDYEIKLVMLTRLHMIELKSNLKKGESNECQFCKEENETTEHILQCKKIEYLKENLKFENVEITHDDSQTSKKIAKFIDRLRRIMI